MEFVEKVASGHLPEEFPFDYESAYDAQSPWSLILSFYPETSTLRLVNFKVNDEVEQMSEALLGYVQAQCEDLGWKEANRGDKESVELHFLKTWLRRTDSTCRQLAIPSHLEDDCVQWVNGIVSVLQLYRRLSGVFEPDLVAFESWAPEDVFEELMKFEINDWTLRQRLEFLVLPYLKFVSRIDLLQRWVSGVEDLSEVKETVFAPELASSLLQVCLHSDLESWPTVKQVIDNLRPVNTNSTEELSWETIFVPSKRSLDFMSSLVEVAKLDRLPAPKFRQLVEWSFGPEKLQEDVLIRFLKSHKHFSAQELAVLRQSVLSKLDETTVTRETVAAALNSSRILYVKSNALKTHPSIVKEVVMDLVKNFSASPTETQLSQLIMGLELLDDEPELLEKYTKLKLIFTTFGVQPSYALAHDPLQNVARALELDANAYLRYTDLVKIIAGEENSALVAEQCIESALADDNFDAVVDFIDRGFVPTTTPSAWLAYYQAGKYVSPSWDQPRSKRVLVKQLEFLSTALSISPVGDMLTMLGTWSSTDKELAEVKAQEFLEKNKQLIEANALHLDTSDDNSDGSTDRPRRPAAEAAKEHISNLLVSGIGWAIGANP